MKSRKQSAYISTTLFLNLVRHANVAAIRDRELATVDYQVDLIKSHDSKATALSSSITLYLQRCISPKQGGSV